MTEDACNTALFDFVSGWSMLERVDVHGTGEIFDEVGTVAMPQKLHT
jgi:hypothetical protein